MAGLTLLDSGPIYRNPDPGYRHVTALFSHLVQLENGEILCLYNRGQAMYAADLTFWQARSSDGGRTWTDHIKLSNRSLDDRPYSYHSPFVSRMADGELVVVSFRVDRSDPDRPIFNEKTGGLTELELFLQRSGDGGQNWSPPEIIAIPEGMVISPSSDIVELADGTWFLACDRWHAFDDPGPYQPRNVGLFSADRGRTWGDPVLFADGSKQGLGFWHGRITPLSDGRLFALFWSAVMRPEMRDLTIHRCYGTEDGRLWTFPKATHLPGQTSRAIDLGNGRLAAIYTTRETARPGFWVASSSDWGASWDLENQIQVWDATGQERLGINAPEAYPRSHDTIAFGAPTGIRLDNGDFLTSFWCTEQAITHVRFALLRLD